MMTFNTFSMDDAAPIYTQILRYIQRGIISGSIQDGDELPSRRMLSAQLGINPNTVQKAYRLLEDEGLIRSQSGAKSVIVVDTAARQRVRQQLLQDDILGMIRAMKQMGLTKQAAAELIQTLWDNDEGSERI